MIGLLGRKIGMTQRFDAQGRRTAVTILQVGPCTVVGVRDIQGRRKVQLGYGASAPRHVNKPEQGHLQKAGIQTPLRHLREFAVSIEEPFTVGQELTAALFEPNDFVDVTAASIGRGFQGGMKRWGWSGGGASHGSMSHRRIGSMGQNTTPGRVLRGHHLPGHMGNRRVTVQNLRVMEVRPEQHVVIVKGAVPGHESSVVMIRKALKRRQKYAPAVAQTQVAVAGEKKAKTAASKKKK